MKMLGRRLDSRCFPRQLLVRRCSSVETEGISESMAVKPTIKRQAIASTLERVDLSVSQPGAMDARSLIEKFKLLHKHQVTIPLALFTDAASALSSRHDATAVHQLVNLGKENLSTDLLPEHEPNPSLEHMLTSTLGGLYRNGAVSDASRFWTEMASGGYRADRMALSRILDSMNSSPKSTPSLEFIASVHTAMVTNLWHQNSNYYRQMLKLLRQHIRTQCKDRTHVHAALAKLDTLWADAKKCHKLSDTSVSHLVSLPADLHTLRVNCYAAAMQALRWRGHTPEDVAVVRCRVEAVSAFEEFLSSCGGVAGQKTFDARSVWNSSMAEALVEEMRSVLQASTLVSRREGSVAPELPEDEVSLSGAEVAAYVVPTGTVSKRINAVHGEVRRAVRVLLAELSSHGQTAEAVALLETYLRMQNRIAVPAPVTALTGAVSVETSNKSALKTAVAAVTSQTRAVPLPTLSKAENAAALYQAEERAWQAQLVCYVMQNCNAAVLATSHRKDGRVQDVVKAGLQECFTLLKAQLRQHQLKPGAAFYAAYIAALRSNVWFLVEERRRHSRSDVAVEVITWKVASAAAEELLASAPEHIRQSPEVREALIQLLCQTSGNDAVDCEGVAKAFDMAQQARKEGHSVSAATLGILLDGATQSMDDKGLTEVLLFVDKELKKNKEWQNASTTEGAVLLRRQIYARCRLRDGARALAQFRELKASGERVELRMYRCLIHALDETMVLDYSEADKILRKPGRTIDFLMQEMKRDQYPMTSEMLDLLLKIYGKAIRRVDAEEGHEMEALVQKMMDFAESFQQTDASGVQTSLINAKVLRQLIKAHCQAGMVEEAEKLLQDAHQKYNVVLKGLCFEPLIYYYGVVRGDLTAADDLLMKMVSRAVPLTQAVVASFAQGYIRNGAAGKALDVIQDLYNQHRVRAPVTVWTALLDNALARGDVHEARRVVYFIQQVFTPQERALLIGMRMDKTGMDSDSKNDEDNNWSEGYDSDYEGRRKLQSLPVELWRRRVPTGLQERGVLSDESLQRRFQAYGLSLQQK